MRVSIFFSWCVHTKTRHVYSNFEEGNISEDKNLSDKCVSCVRVRLSIRKFCQFGSFVVEFFARHFKFRCLKSHADM